ncbi:hypothetical protein [Tenacibaculum halocynthiae]|uniref:hypothetical protein n=1 Tax=Tenacibaculum halocynthiae TaxID=1254437 RepID=UPI003D6502F2
MYLEGIITIDPSQLTEIKKVKPTKAFKKFFHHLTLGVISDKEERETFTAVAILQQLNATFRSLKINNIIKISHDDIDFYHDKDGKENDLKHALDKYEIEINDAMSIHFKQLKLVLEHKDFDFKYLIEIEINRDHKIGVFPLVIKISGLFKELESGNPNKTISQATSSQLKFDQFKEKKTSRFDYFLNKIKLELKKQVETDDIKSFIKNKHVLPKQKVNTKEDIRYNTKRGGIYGGYHGFDDYLFYSLIWSDIMHHNNNIVITDSYYENDSGEDIGYAKELEVSNDAFNSESNNDLTDSVTFEEDPLSINEPPTDESSNWFDFNSWGGDSDSNGFDFSSSPCSNCSSCSSCASCGGD